MNILIKLMSIVSLVIAPYIVGIGTSSCSGEEGCCKSEMKKEVLVCNINGKEYVCSSKAECDSIMNANKKDIAELNGMYEVDGTHSSVGFAIRHIVTTTNGSILIDSGIVAFKNGGVEKMFFQIDVNTINTQSGKRDEHLKGEDFFEVNKYPKMTFNAIDIVKDTTSIEFSYVAIGELTIKGVTKQVSIPFRYIGLIEESFVDAGKEITISTAGFEGNLKISRKDFKIGEEGSGLGDEVTINFTIEANQKLK